MLERVQQYFNSSEISQSQLKALLIGVGAFHTIKKEGELYYEEKEFLIIGSAVDCILTERNKDNHIDLESFLNNYYISIIEKPSDTIMSIVQEIYSKIDKDDITELSDIKYSLLILSVCNSHKYQNNWKDETRIKKIVDEGTLYWNELIKSDNKQILDKNQAMIIWNVVVSLLTHKHTKNYFESNDNITILFQVPIYFIYEELECKALLDLIIIDKKNRCIIPCDIKTIGDFTNNFLNNAKRFRYDFQATFYILALMSWIKENYLEDYSIKDFKFIVESTKQQGCPLIYNFNKQNYLSVLNGIPSETIKTSFGNKNITSEIKGVKQAVELLKWYKSNHPEMQYNKEIIEGNGELQLNIWVE